MVLLLAWDACSTPADSTWHSTLCFEYNLWQFRFLPLCPLSHQSTNNPHLGIWSPETKFSFLSHCQEIHPKVRRETKLKNKIPTYSIALKCWNASKLFSRKYGCYWNKIFSLFHWNFNVSTTCVVFFRGGGQPGGLFLYPLWLNGAHSAVWFELSFFLTQVSKLSMTFKTDVVTSSNKRYMNSYKGHLSTRAV